MCLNKIYLILLCNLLLFSTCKLKETVKISVNENSNFPVISIENPYGLPIKISPISNSEGSVGFESNKGITWLTGMPEKTKEGNSTIYAWSVEDNKKIILKIEIIDDKVKLFLALENGEEISPSEWYINLTADNDEYFTGLFESVVDGNQNKSWEKGITTSLNLRGEIINMKLKPTVSAYAPFYISSNNYSFFVHGTWPGVFDFCKTDMSSVRISFEGPTLSVSFHVAETPAELVQQHALETGPSFVPPKWAFGQWRWRDNHYHKDEYYDGTKVHAPFNSDVVEDVFMMLALDIPMSAYWIDRPWGPGERGFDDYKIDTARLPAFEEMITWLNNRDIELMMWIGPFVMGEMADYAVNHNYHLSSKDYKKARQVLMDFTNEEGCKWWGENGPAKLARMGVKGYKLDRADGEKLADSIHLLTSIGTTYRENYNDYPLQYVKATYDAVQPILGDDFILFPRAQYTGSAKYGAMWAGDIRGYHEGLRSAVIAMQRCAVMGYPNWGSDVGGYGKSGFTHEACVRWLGFGCFSPIMETGPTLDEGFWNMRDEPTYDTLLLATWRLYSITRLKIVDYIYKLSVEANKTGMPVARPLFLLYPEQENAWEDWQTYLLGPDILVSVVWEKGKMKHKLYLPKGEKWIDAWDKSQIYDGGQYVEVETPLYKIPLFIRKGSDIDLGDLPALYEESRKKVAVKPDLKKLEEAEGWR